MQTVIDIVEKAFLIMIGLFTIGAMAQEILDIVLIRQFVELKDLLLMFIFAEVIGMIGAYYSSKRIPINLPLFIAITALSRLIILGDKDNPQNLIYEGGAILLIAVAGLIMRLRMPPREGSRAMLIDD